MHMGALATIGKLAPKNFYHILLNNFVHESVGSQKTSAEYIDMPKLFSSNNYNKVFSIKTEVELLQIFPDFYQFKWSKFFRDANKSRLKERSRKTNYKAC